MHARVCCLSPAYCPLPSYTGIRYPPTLLPSAPPAHPHLLQVTDSYFKALEPPRKLRVPSLPAQVSDQLTTLDKTLGTEGSSLKVRRVGTPARAREEGKKGGIFLVLWAAAGCHTLSDCLEVLCHDASLTINLYRGLCAKPDDKLLHFVTATPQALLQKAVSERAYVEAGGKPVPGFKYVTAADAERALALRRQKLHARFLGMWARRIMATPEQALVPLNERDQLLASKFEVRRHGVADGEGKRRSRAGGCM